MKKIIFLLTFSGSAFLFSCSDVTKNDTTTVSTMDSTSFDLSRERNWVEADNAKFMERIKKADSTGLVDHYHSDALVMMANADPVMRKDIGSAWGGFFRMGIKDLKVTTNELVGNNDLMVETGSFEMFGDKNMLMDKGNYVVVWKKENGSWKIYRDIPISNMSITKK